MCEMDICKMKERLVEAMCSQMENGMESVDTEEAGQVIDMIKDLAQTEYYCSKADYYETVKEAMKSGESYSFEDTDAFRRRFKMGYMPEKTWEHDERYSKAYRDWQDARRHYTQSKSTSDKDEMDAHAREHLGDTISSMRDIWKSADTDLKKRMKADLSALVAEMTV